MTDYCTLAQVVAAPDLPAEADEARIEQAITAASRAIDRYLDVAENYYAAGASPDDDETRYYDGSDLDELWLNDQLISITTISIDENGDEVFTALTTDDYWLWPANTSPTTRLDINPNGDYSKWPVGKRRIKIAGLFGIFASVPANVTEACIIQAVRLYKSGRQSFADSGARASQSGEITIRLAMHPMARQILDDMPAYNEVI